MKVYWVLLLILLAGCSSARGPVTRLAHLQNNNNVVVWDEARHLKSYLKASSAVSPGVSAYIEKILVRVQTAHTEAVQATSSFASGETSQYHLETALQAAYTANLEIFSTLTAFMLSTGGKR